MLGKLGAMRGTKTGPTAAAAAAAAPALLPASTKRRELSEDQAARMAQRLREAAITGANPEALNRAILERIPRNARFVLIGEASHGTREFYDQRSELTKLLIQERGFHAVCAEADFPDMARANAYVRGRGRDSNGEEALRGFTRFPMWMWRNASMEAFVDWLRQYNAQVARAGGTTAAAAAGRESGVRGPAKAARTEAAGAGSPAGPEDMAVDQDEHVRQGMVGLYGMDVYSLHRSAAAVIDYLKRVDPAAGEEAEMRYRCFDKYGADAQSYGLAVGAYRQPGCTREALDQLSTTHKRVADIRRRDGSMMEEEEALEAEVNAMVVAGAERYYRAMFFSPGGRDVTWNLRDTHFRDVVRMVEQHIASRGVDQPRIVLWAHNSHLGDARATDMSWRRSEVNVGQLVRETWGREATYNIGFTTHTGTVAASDDWGKPVRTKRVNPSMQGSIEDVMHRVGLDHFAVETSRREAREVLQGLLLERAIGVIYRPDTERWSHYFDAYLPGQFDLVIHVEHTQAVQPLPLPPADTASPEVKRRARQGVELTDSGFPSHTPEKDADLPETFPEAV